MNKEKYKKKVHIVAIANQKGGVGKTTTTVNLATAIASIGRKVLVIDGDAQGNLSTSLGVSTDKRKKTLCDIILKNLPPELSVIETYINHLHIIPSTIDLALIDKILANTPRGEIIIKEKMMSFFEEYDYVFFDCPPALSILTVNILACSTGVLIPLQCEFLSMEGLAYLFNTIKLIQSTINPKLKIEGIVMTMYDRRNNLSNEILEDVKNEMKSMVYNTIIPRNIKLSEAPSHGKPGILYDSKCSGTLAYIMLAKEFLEKIERN